MEILFTFLRMLGNIFIQFPFMAAVPTVMFAVMFYLAKKKSLLLAGVLWLAYLVYEYAMKLRILCTGECNIRIDLLLVYPILIGVSVVAVIAFIQKMRKGREV